jgi:hypothetical protein
MPNSVILFKSPIYLLLKLMSISFRHRQPTIATFGGAVVVMIVWLLDLQLHMQAVSITTKVGSLNPAPKM